MATPAWLQDRQLNFERGRENRASRDRNFQGALGAGIQGLNSLTDLYKQQLMMEAQKRAQAEDAYFKRAELEDRRKGMESREKLDKEELSFRERDAVNKRASDEYTSGRDNEAALARTTEQGKWGVNKARETGEYGLRREDARGDTALQVAETGAGARVESANIGAGASAYRADKGLEGTKYATDSRERMAEMNAEIKKEYGDRYLTNLEGKTAADIEQSKLELDAEIEDDHAKLKLMERGLDQEFRKDEHGTQLKAMELKFKIDNAVWARENLTAYQQENIDIGEQNADTGTYNAKTNRKALEAKEPVMRAQAGKLEAETANANSMAPLNQAGKGLANQALSAKTANANTAALSREQQEAVKLLLGNEYANATPDDIGDAASLIDEAERALAPGSTAMQKATAARELLRSKAQR
jgi:hypothetical protein